MIRQKSQVYGFFQGAQTNSDVLGTWVENFREASALVRPVRRVFSGKSEYGVYWKKESVW